MDTFVSQKRTWKIWHALNLRKKRINKITRSSKQTSKWIKALNKDSFTSNKTDVTRDINYEYAQTRPARGACIDAGRFLSREAEPERAIRKSRAGWWMCVYGEMSDPEKATTMDYGQNWQLYNFVIIHSCGREGARALPQHDPLIWFDETVLLCVSAVRAEKSSAHTKS